MGTTIHMDDYVRIRILPLISPRMLSPSPTHVGEQQGSPLHLTHKLRCPWSRSTQTRPWPQGPRSTAAHPLPSPLWPDRPRSSLASSVFLRCHCQPGWDPEKVMTFGKRRTWQGQQPSKRAGHLEALAPWWPHAEVAELTTSQYANQLNHLTTHLVLSPSRLIPRLSPSYPFPLAHSTCCTCSWTSRTDCKCGWAHQSISSYPSCTSRREACGPRIRTGREDPLPGSQCHRRPHCLHPPQSDEHARRKYC